MKIPNDELFQQNAKELLAERILGPKVFSNYGNKIVRHAQGKHRTVCGRVVQWNTLMSSEESPISCINCLKRLKQLGVPCL